MAKRTLIGIYGGTFDPIHEGHVLSAAELCQQLDLDALRFLPCHQPPHRERPLANSRQRLAMVALAIAGRPRLCVDDRELQRAGPSYTVDTLEQLRAELGEEVSLCWIMGSDAFAGLDSWQQWQRLPELAHLVVMARPGEGIPADCPAYRLWLQRGITEPSRLRESAAGSILLQTLTQHPVSATMIRQALTDQEDEIKGLAPAVLDYINSEQLYR